MQRFALALLFLIAVKGQVYVSPTGSTDSTCGSHENPCKNIPLAISVAADGGQIRLMDGVYGGSDNVPFVLGNTTTHISLVSDGGQATINCSDTINGKNKESCITILIPATSDSDVSLTIANISVTGFVGASPSDGKMSSPLIRLTQGKASSGQSPAKGVVVIDSCQFYENSVASLSTFITDKVSSNSAGSIFDLDRAIFRGIDITISNNSFKNNQIPVITAHSLSGNLFIKSNSFSEFSAPQQSDPDTPSILTYFFIEMVATSSNSAPIISFEDNTFENFTYPSPLSIPAKKIFNPLIALSGSAPALANDVTSFVFRRNKWLGNIYGIPNIIFIGEGSVAIFENEVVSIQVINATSFIGNGQPICNGVNASQCLVPSSFVIISAANYSANVAYIGGTIQGALNNSTVSGTGNSLLMLNAPGSILSLTNSYFSSSGSLDSGVLVTGGGSANLNIFNSTFSNIQYAVYANAVASAQDSSVVNLNIVGSVFTQCGSQANNAAVIYTGFSSVYLDSNTFDNSKSSYLLYCGEGTSSRIFFSGNSPTLSGSDSHKDISTAIGGSCAVGCSLGTSSKFCNELVTNNGQVILGEAGFITLVVITCVLGVATFITVALLIAILIIYFKKKPGRYEALVN